MVNKPEKLSNIHKKNISNTVKRAVLLSLIWTLSLNTPTMVSGGNTKAVLPKKEIVEPKYTYEECLSRKPSELSDSLVKKTMLHRLNDIRKQHNLKPLKYNKQLDHLALKFATEKTGTQRWENQWMHFDKDSLGVIDRAKKEWLWENINKHVVDDEVMGLWENLISTNVSIEKMLDALMHSPGHRKRLLCPYITEAGFWYEKGYTILVQIFADFNKN